jgi:peroxiredoxin
MAATSRFCDFGWQAPDFALPATDGRVLSLAEIRGDRGTVVAFICNHCPYVLGSLDRLTTDMRDLQAMGVGVAAICSNDANAYPEDSFDEMCTLADRAGFSFPYLHDETQAVARAWDAVCTPDFFGFDAELGLQYRGRLDAAGRNPCARGMARDLVDAMALVVETGQGPRAQVPSVGCSIKWKA